MEGEVVGIGADAILFLSDQERTLVALKDEAAIRVNQKGANVQTEESARYDSWENGLAEAAVKAAKDKVRTLFLGTNSSYGITLDGNHMLMPCLVRCCRGVFAVPMVAQLTRDARGDSTTRALSNRGSGTPLSARDRESSSTCG